MSADLFDGAYPDPGADQIPEGLGKDARRTLRQKAMIDAGTHPATKCMLIEHDPSIELNAPTCGTCEYLTPKFSGGWSGWKCTKAAAHGNDGPDIRKWWPACVLYSPKAEVTA